MLIGLLLSVRKQSINILYPWIEKRPSDEFVDNFFYDHNDCYTKCQLESRGFSLSTGFGRESGRNSVKNVHTHSE